VGAAKWLASGAITVFRAKNATAVFEAFCPSGRIEIPYQKRYQYPRIHRAIISLYESIEVLIDANGDRGAPSTKNTRNANIHKKLLNNNKAGETPFSNNSKKT